MERAKASIDVVLPAPRKPLVTMYLVFAIGCVSFLKALPNALKGSAIRQRITTSALPSKGVGSSFIMTMRPRKRSSRRGALLTLREVPPIISRSALLSSRMASMMRCMSGISPKSRMPGADDAAAHVAAGHSLAVGHRLGRKALSAAGRC